ncbi:hypothetical protein OQA88_8818 [Cercophora sp. LCS_1]
MTARNFSELNFPKKLKNMWLNWVMAGGQSRQQEVTEWRKTAAAMGFEVLGFPVRPVSEVAFWEDIADTPMLPGHLRTKARGSAVKGKGGKGGKGKQAAATDDRTDLDEGPKVKGKGKRKTLVTLPHPRKKQRGEAPQDRAAEVEVDEDNADTRAKPNILEPVDVLMVDNVEDPENTDLDTSWLGKQRLDFYDREEEHLPSLPTSAAKEPGETRREEDITTASSSDPATPVLEEPGETRREEDITALGVKWSEMDPMTTTHPPTVSLEFLGSSTTPSEKAQMREGHFANGNGTDGQGDELMTEGSED